MDITKYTCFILLFLFALESFTTYAAYTSFCKPSSSYSNGISLNSHNNKVCYKDNKTIGPDYGISSLNRTSFPAGFLFGSSSAAYQYEGAPSEDGKGPSIWDTYTHKFPEDINKGANGDVAADSYHRYKEDVKIVKETGLDAYRFSISWPRVLPYGKVSKGVNKKGIQYYHNLIDELLANGIQPFVTIFHFDLPQGLQDEYGGFLSSLIVDDFRDFADLCFKEYGQKVKHWMTLNEPWTYSSLMFDAAILSAKNCSKSDPKACKLDYGTQPYIAGHYHLLAHAAAVQVYRQKYQASQKGVIGLVLNTNWNVPYSETKNDRDAASRALDFMFGWFMDPITFGDYPQTMRSLVGSRLPKFTKEQSTLLKGSYDFLGLNYYTSFYAVDAPSLKSLPPNYTTDSLVTLKSVRDGIPIGPKGAMDWLNVYPRGIYDLLLHIKGKYNDPTIYVTENGFDDANNPKLSLEEALTDSMRLEYYHDHISFAKQALRDGVKLKGFFAWSLLDNFEWKAGYSVRFGIYFVDFKDLKRYAKHSGTWFKNFLQK